MAPLSSAAMVEESPLISSGFVYRLMAGVAVLAALTVAISVGGNWLGEKISLAGHTTDTKPISITIGDDTIRLAANTIRFPSERLNGPAERVDLYLTWPQMQGYSEADRLRFDDISQASSLIFLQISQSTMSRDMSGRLGPIYSQLMDGASYAGPFGLTAHRLRADAGYNGEILLTASRSGETDYVVRCLLPSSPALATSGDCQRDVKVGKDLSVLYRFSSNQLGDWRTMDAAVQDFVKTRLVDDAAPAAMAVDGR
ncbi:MULTISPECIES: hypothetical protein [unclassified Rhizobium]|uniref:hypothetical protein n=1 Tax=unclassified Rhizobium TaxID=2613769 RepID=UPI001826619E|nr:MULTISPECIES: hypothetical protein [unclassified Rhizobium]MBB3382264.1 hypothetical protein [Rhizobium sp. BK098]MBB3613966.1 hypothetical protein [Rhizobium sp. BK609]MBB3679624.1 hypothetical protein [Rhizobium sp. BK612]